MALDILFSKRIFVHKAEDSRRKPQQGWTPCEDFQRRKCRFGDKKTQKLLNETFAKKALPS
ncbi:hypothetical protein, partial [Neisseria sp. HMSC064E01]|uniref:hypothetical protein n=1 Tax=Neisseria sp. HMSC064E01 TaxID=1715052 RepID=UPI001AEF8BFA